MPEHDDLKDFGVLNPETHHETSDVDVRAILWFVVIFLAFAVVTHLLLYFLFQFFKHEFRRDVQPARTAIKAPAQMPQTPRLQPFKQKEMPPYESTPVIDMVETHWPRDRDSRIVERENFGAMTSRLWKTLREESMKTMGRTSAAT